MGAIRRKLTYSNVVASLALFVALGGISYAALSLPRDSVGTKHVRDGAITPKKLGFSLGLAENSGGPASFDASVCPDAALCPAPWPHMLTSTRVRLEPGDRALLLGSATVHRERAGSSPIFVTLGTTFDDDSAGGDHATLEDTQPVRLDVRRVVSAPAGRKRGRRYVFELDAAGTVSDLAGAEVDVLQSHLIVIALPAAR